MFVVIGTTTVDLIVRDVGRAALGDGFRGDNLVFCNDSLLMLMGGNGGNSAYVLARLGTVTALCSSIGQDDLGDWLGGKLAAQGVNLDGLLRRADLATSTSTILLDSAESQVVFHHKGATDALQLTAVHERQLAEAEVLLAGSYTLLSGLRPEGFARALHITHEAGGITALDIGPAVGEPARLPEIAPLFGDLDYLIANTHELAVCTGAPDWETAAAELLAHDCSAVVVKRGSRGASYRSGSLNLDVAAFPTSANISVGAGDSFNAGFLLALQQKRPPADALRFGSAVAAWVVGGAHGVLSAPTQDDVETLWGM